MSDKFLLFKTKRFLPLFVTQFFGAFNDNAFKNAFLIWFTYDLATKTGQNPQIIVNVASALFILPFLLFSYLAGQVADKFEKSKLVRIIKMVEIFLMIFCFLGFYLQSLTILLAILFLMGVQSTFFGPLKLSLLPFSLRKNELVLGNGLIEGGTFIAILLGTIIGGLFIRHQYGVEIISVIVVLFAIIGYFSSYFIPEVSLKEDDLKISFNIYSKTLEIIKFASLKREILVAILAISWFWLLGMVFLAEFPIYTKNIIKGDEKIVTLFLSIFSIAIAVGCVLCNKILGGKINTKLVPYGSLGMSFSIILFYVLSQFYEPQSELVSFYEFLFGNIFGFLICLSLFFLAMFSGIFIVPLYALIQHLSDPKQLARIIAANNVINAIFMVFASILVLLLFALGLKVDEIFLVSGILNLVIFYFLRRF